MTGLRYRQHHHHPPKPQTDDKLDRADQQQSCAPFGGCLARENRLWVERGRVIRSGSSGAGLGLCRGGGLGVGFPGLD